MTQGKNLFIETFGCQMNVSDSEKITALLANIGYKPTADSTLADLIILNTCSIRDKAEQKVYSQLGRYKGLKKKNDRLLLGVGGCVAQQEGDRLLARVPYLDLVFGTHNIHLLPDIVKAAEDGERKARVQFLDNDSRRDLFPSVTDAGGFTRFVTVIQGCDNFCSYCIVPYVRGREVSRKSADILAEIASLAEKGVKEVTLIGQNVNSYGLNTPGEMTFAQLLHATAGIEGIERVRFTTSHPKDISDELIACFAEIPKLCSHLHLPAQSGSDKILSLMNRGYTRRDYLDRVKALRAVRPDIQITGDIIVGFPGESDEDFQLTLSLMEEVGFADLFSFIYSPRPETKAAALTDVTGHGEKLRRLEILQSLQKSMTHENNKTFEGSIQKVLVEGVSREEGKVFGRISGNRIVIFPADSSMIGSIVDVRITKATRSSLIGECSGSETGDLE